MIREHINADFSQRVVLSTNELPWVPSPQPGVERRLLDRVGGEIARATSLVRYAAASSFPAHVHALGEEFLVLDGVFSDELGDYAAGTYVRNPPGSRHVPRTGPGCTILVKLRQMTAAQSERVVIETAHATWEPGDIAGHARLRLYETAGAAVPAQRVRERVTMERLVAGSALPPATMPAGEEIFVLSGELSDESGHYAEGCWIRNPPGYRRSLRSGPGATFWSKRGHLTAAVAGGERDGTAA